MKSWRILSAVPIAALVFIQGLHSSAQTSDAPPDASQPAPAPTPVPTRLALSPNLSSASREVVKLVSGGISTDVIKAYIDNSASAFNLTADGIIKLQNAGVPNLLVTAMMAHDKEMRDRGQIAVLPPPAPQYPPPTQYPPPDQTGTASPPMAPQPYDFGNQPAPPDYGNLSPYGSWYYDQPESEWYWSPYPSLWNYGYPWGITVLNNGRWWYHNNHGWVWSRGEASHGGRSYYSTPPYRGGATQVFAHQNFGGVQTTVIHPGFVRGGGGVARSSPGYGGPTVGGHH